MGLIATTEEGLINILAHKNTPYVININYIIEIIKYMANNRQELEFQLEIIRNKRSIMELERKATAAEKAGREDLTKNYKEEKEVLESIHAQKQEELKVQKQINVELDRAIEVLELRMPKSLKQLITNTKSFGEQLQNAFKVGKGILDVLTSWKGALGLATTAFAMIVDAEEKVNQYMREWVRATSSVAKEVGGMTKQWPEVKRAISDTWGMAARYGVSVQEAADHVKEIVLAFSSTAGIEKYKRLSFEFAQGLGLGSTDAGKLLFSLEKSGQSLEDMKKIEGDIINISKKMGIPIGKISKDMSNSVDKMAAFGSVGIREMPRMIAFARQLGLGFEQMYKSMEVFDRVSTGSEAVNKIGSIFGVQLSTLELLSETSPDKRLEKVRDALLASNKEWKNMNYYEVKALSQTLNLSEEGISMIFKKENKYKSVAQIQKDLDKENENRQKAEAKRQTDINKILSETTSIFRDLRPTLQGLYSSINKAFEPLFDQLFGTRKGLLEGLTKFFNRLARDDTWKTFIKGFADVIKYLGEMMKRAMEWLTPQRLGTIMKGYGIVVGARTIMNLGKDNGMSFGMKDVGAIGGALGAGKLMGGLGLEKNLGSFVGGAIAGNFGKGPISSAILAALGTMGGSWLQKKYGDKIGLNKGQGMLEGFGNETLKGIFKSLGISSDEKGDKKENKLSDTTDLISREYAIKKEEISEIYESIKKNKSLNEINEKQKEILKGLGINIGELSDKAVMGLVDKLYKGEEAFEGFLQKLDLLKPTQEEIAVKKAQLKVDVMKNRNMGNRSVSDIQKEIDSVARVASDTASRKGDTKFEEDRLVKLYAEKSRVEKDSKDLAEAEYKLKEKGVKLETATMNFLELKLMQMEFREQYKDDLGNMTYEDKVKAWKEKTARMTEEGKAMAMNFKPFASGGIVSSPTLALIGERGPEKITPLSGGSSGGGTVYLQPIELKINERVLGQALIRIANSGG